MAKHSRPGANPVSRRADVYAEKMQTRLCLELPAPGNPFVASRKLWYGYDTLDLARQRSLVDVIYLMFKGELPEAGQARLLEQLMLILAHPGPRHGATRAVANASVSRAAEQHWLPLGMTMLGGEQGGAMEVAASMRFICKHMGSDPQPLVAELARKLAPEQEGDISLAPGFGTTFGALDSYARSVADFLLGEHPEAKALAWTRAFATSAAEVPAGYLMTGVAAAAMVDIGIPPKAGTCLYQMSGAPGLAAQGLELSGKPITAMPFVDDAHYVIEEGARDGQG